MGNELSEGLWENTPKKSKNPGKLSKSTNCGWVYTKKSSEELGPAVSRSKYKRHIK